MSEGPVLKVISPEGDERRVSFSQAEIQIGSSLDSTLVLGGHGVSSKHCRISVRGDALVVTDRGSKNGTFINSRRCIEPTELRPGDRLSVGAYTIELAAPAARPSRQQALPVALARGEDELRAAERARLARYAREWADAARPRRLLLRGRDLALALAWMASPAQRAEVEAEPLLRELVAASARDQLLRRALALGAAGVALGGLVVALVARAPQAPPPQAPPPDAHVEPRPAGQAQTSPPAARERLIEHVISPGETCEEIARYYEVSTVALQASCAALKPGDTLQLRTTKDARPPLVEEHHVIEEGEDWLSIANQYNTTVDKIRGFNPHIDRDRLRPGDALTLWIDAQFGAQTPNPDNLPIFIVPGGSTSLGGVTSGALVNPVQLLPSPLAEVRCAAHAYATSFTIAQLLKAVATFRSEANYKGQVMIADLSLKNGGQYGHHKSHQSGRDADIWLLPRAKQFTRGCRNCSTASCRPEPEDVDWRLTWRFIRALESTGYLKEVFLSDFLQPKLHAAALELGETKEDLRPLIQYPRGKGTPALVMHSDGHIHHIHVRFKCDPSDLACSEAK